MATRHLYEHDIPEIEQTYAKFSSPHNSTPSHLSPVLSTHHPDFGTFNASSLMLPQLCLVDMQWNVPDDLVIHESNPSQTVDINFMLEGGLNGKYKGLDSEFSMPGGFHNMKYTPSEKASHHAGKQNAKMFVVSLDKNYFCSLIGTEDRWAEDIHRKIEREENFLGSKNFLAMSPTMHSLVSAIRNMQPSSVNRLMTQSMIFELLAHQIDQMRLIDKKVEKVDALNVNDLEKLHFVKQYIDQNFLTDITLTALCRLGTLNEFKLKKGFKALFDSSVIHYVKKLRMQHAQILLRDYRKSIEEVSSLLGYQYPNHFSVAYKKHFGIPPSQSSARTLR
jgi:AraC family transcriptional regulator, transcriptional activator of the genes for pyochelin and ferripyochelin receptors